MIRKIDTKKFGDVVKRIVKEEGLEKDLQNKGKLCYFLIPENKISGCIGPFGGMFRYIHERDYTYMIVDFDGQKKVDIHYIPKRAPDAEKLGKIANRLASELNKTYEALEIYVRS